MKYIKRLCAALAAAMLITLVGCNAAVTSPVQGEEELCLDLVCLRLRADV